MAEPKVAYIWEDKDNHVSVDMPAHPPRLMRALLWAKPAQYEGYLTALDKAIASKQRGPVSLDSAANFEDELGALLEHIHERLKQGLDEAWSSKYGYNPPEIPKDDGKKGAEEFAAARKKALENNWALVSLYSEPEEKWARAFAEMFVYMPYGGPATMTLGFSSTDKQLYQQWPKLYPLVAACQHLSTYAVLSRGFTPDTVGTGLEAGPNGSVPVFSESLPTSSTKRPSWSTAPVSSVWENDLRQGDLVSGDDGAQTIDPKDGQKKRLFGHSASTLRRWPLGKAAAAAPEGAKAQYKLQMIDTGVLAGVGDTSTQDYEWLKSINGFGKAKEGRTGFGRLPEPSDLASAVEVMKKALPMGFARLVLVSSDSGTVRYVSAMLPMWNGDDRFAFTRYVWSLRDLPATGVDAYWIVYVPLRSEALFNEIVAEAASPSRSCQQIVEAAGVSPPFIRALASGASIKGKPRVVRLVTKSDTAWKEIDPKPKDKNTPDEPDDGAPTLLKAATAVAPSLDLNHKLDPVPGVRPGGWSFLEAKEHLSKELLIPPGTKSSAVAGRLMTENKAPYFKG